MTPPWLSAVIMLACVASLTVLLGFRVDVPAWAVVMYSGIAGSVGVTHFAVSTTTPAPAKGGGG